MNDHLLPRSYRSPVSFFRIQQICRYIANCLPRLDVCQSSRIQQTSFLKTPIHVVCISDTHSRTLDLPVGDLLIHAGDLTQYGSFVEMQAQLDWLGSQPHRYKVIVGGNHDIILDQDAVSRRLIVHDPNSKRGSQQKLDWRGCCYLQNDTMTFEFTEMSRTLKIFGSPMTPDCGNWAFQYPAIKDVWSMVIPDDCDVIITHCPPALYRDGRGIGDGYLLHEIRRVKPILAVFGHAHDGYGVDMLYHGNHYQSLLDDIKLNQRPFWALVKMIRLTLWQYLLGTCFDHNQERTVMVNAAITGLKGGQRAETKAAIEVFL